MYDPRCSVWKVWSPWRLCTHIAGYWFWEGGNHPGDYGLVTQSAVSGKRLTWRLWTCGPMYMTLGVTLDISDIKIQVQCLDGVSPWRMWPCYKDSGSGAG